MKYCSDYPDAPPCCSTCHTEDNWGISPLLEYVNEKNIVEAKICCAVNEYLVDKE